MLRLKSFIIITFGFFALALSEEKINNKGMMKQHCPIYKRIKMFKMVIVTVYLNSTFQ
jgi:hypothetical protein